MRCAESHSVFQSCILDYFFNVWQTRNRKTSCDKTTEEGERNEKKRKEKNGREIKPRSAICICICGCTEK